jgi:hypothetical protein
MSTKYRGPLFFVLLHIALFSYAATKVSNSSGLWSNGSIWNASGVPLCGDSIIILAGHDVTITSNQNYACGTRMAVVVNGTLTFMNMSKLRLPCNSSFYVFPGGRVTSPSSGQNDRIEICGTDYWDGSMGDLVGPACLPPGSCFGILAVSLADFNGSPCDNGSICLNWETVTEKNSSHFEVQRLSGQDFDGIQVVPSFANGGNSNTSIKYSYVDKSAQTGINYYRLKMVEFAGHTSSVKS